MEQDMILCEASLLDELEETIYVGDIRGYSLLYLNRAGRSLTGLKQENVQNNKCRRVLQGRDTPCPFCTNAELSKDDFCVWGYEDPRLNKNFIVKDRLVGQKRRPARIEIAADVEDHVKERGSHTSRYHMETVTLETLRVLNTADYLDDAINRTLKMVTDFYGGEWACIIKIDRVQGFARNTCKWCRAGIPSRKITLQQVSLDGIPYLFETFNKKQHLVISKTGELGNSCPSEYRYLTARNTDNLFTVPFRDESAFNGYVGVSNPSINQDTVKLLDSITCNIANEIEKRRLYRRLEYEATYGGLDGLLNRESLVHFHNDSMRNGKAVSCGIVAGDTNDLKQLNHDCGQSRGNATIKEAASVMASSFAGASIFRLSGGEFIIVSLESAYKGFMERVGKMEWVLDGRTPDSISLGCTWEEHLTDFDRLMRHTEELMLVNKQIYYKDSGRGHKHYSPECLNHLLQDMEEGCYRLCLQPKYNPLTGKVYSAEALVRYRAAGTEPTQPLDFVSLLEETKLIRYLDFYIPEQVFKLLSGWKERGGELTPISVNFSRTTLLEGGLFRVLADMQKRYRTPARLVMIKITGDIGDIEHKMIKSIGSRLREAGFRISLGDFEANYANISTLSITQFDEVKLDKPLMDNPVENQTSQAVVKCTIDMCHGLQMECVAEGVENQKQLELLASFGCTATQGYYYSRPLEVVEFERIWDRLTLYQDALYTVFQIRQV